MSLLIKSLTITTAKFNPQWNKMRTKQAQHARVKSLDQNTGSSTHQLRAMFVIYLSSGILSRLFCTFRRLCFPRGRKNY